jgi:hypothetical protein
MVARANEGAGAFRGAVHACGAYLRPDALDAAVEAGGAVDRSRLQSGDVDDAGETRTAAAVANARAGGRRAVPGILDHDRPVR